MTAAVPGRLPARETGRSRGPLPGQYRCPPADLADCLTGPLEDLRTLLARYPELAAEPGLMTAPDLAEGADLDGLPLDGPRPAGPPLSGPRSAGPSPDGPPADDPPADDPPADGPPADGPPADGPPADSPPPAGRPPASREVLKAGFWDRTRADGAGFAAGGVADNLPPGPVLAGFAADVWAGGLARISDDELIGVLRAARRLVSWATALELAASGDLWRRRVAIRWPHQKSAQRARFGRP